MCDFSLESYKSRRAKKGDRLTSKTFGSGSKGFVEEGGDQQCAVCLQPGTRLSITKPDGTATTAIFVQPDKQPPGHRDSLLFAGTDVPESLQKLAQGTQATVDALPGEALPFDEEDTEAAAAAIEKEVISSHEPAHVG